MISQRERVLEMLKRGPVTPLDALRAAGCFRLAAVVHRLRGEGHLIHTERYEVNNGKHVARYHYQGEEL